jgi:hypothetical protein
MLAHQVDEKRGEDHRKQRLGSVEAEEDGYSARWVGGLILQACWKVTNTSFQRQRWIRNAAMKIASAASYASSPKSVASTNTIMT